MTHADRLDTDIFTFLERHERKDLVRFVTVGSVDDGKSTLIGRLLHDTQGVYEDQLEDARGGRGGTTIDFALLTDGLRAEREQGITIDVAYRYFTTPRRKFIIADTPGHVQYTRNMATGASTADIAIILIDARYGVLTQSRRHAWIASLLGIPHLVAAINKMDLRGYDQAVFETFKADLKAVTAAMSFRAVHFIPISALEGDNVVARSANMPWYSGPTLIEFLETVEVTRDVDLEALRYPVQMVIRPHQNYRGFAGQIASGVVRKGDPIMVLPSGKTSHVRAIDTMEGELEEAFAPMSVTLRLTDEVDVSRGDVLMHPEAPASVARRIAAHVVWMHEDRLEPGRTYLLKHNARYIRAQFGALSWKLDMETLERLPASELHLNDIGAVEIACDRPLIFDPYRENRLTGAFIVIDALTNNTVGAGMIIGAVEEEASALDVVTARERAMRLGHRGLVAWLVGDAAATEVATIERRVFDLGLLAYVLDAGGPEAVETSRHLAQAGLVVLVVDPDGQLSPDTLSAEAVPHLVVDVGSIGSVAAAVERIGVAARVEV